MKKYSEVIGLPVICAIDAEKVGAVKDLVFCPGERRVVAFILEKKGYEMKKKTILMKDVISVGTDAVIIESLNDVKKFKKIQDSPELKDKGNVIGLRIFSRSGKELGIVKDVLFDPLKGTIEGVEVSDGLFTDIVNGRNLLPLFGKVEFSEENILVENEAIEEIMESGKGLKNLIEKNK